MTRKMKDSGVEWIGEIPEEWEVTKIKNHFLFEKGKNASIYTNEYIGLNAGEYPVFSGQTEDQGIMGKINTYDYDIQECVFTTTVGAKVMTPKFLKGRFSLSQNCLIIKKNGKIDCKYLYYSLYPLFEYEKSLIPSYMQPSLRISDLKKYFIIYNREQTNIANYLDSKSNKIDETIEKQKKVIEKLKEYKQSIITEAVTKGLNPDVKMKDSGVEWIGEIPYIYNIIRFGRIAKVMSNLVNVNEYSKYKQVSPESIEKNTGKLFGCKTVEESGVISDNHLFYEGQILYSKVRPKLNKVTIAPFDGLCSADMYPIETTINHKFLMYYMLSNTFLLQVTMNDNRVKMPKINKEELSSIIVIVPSDKDQQQIVDYLDKKGAAIDKAIYNKEKLIEKLTEYKKSLIYECVTGKREV